MAQSIAQEQVVAVMLEKLEVVSQLIHGFAYKNYFQADTAQKLSLILAAEDFILEIKQNTSIDWTIKENAKAKLKLIVKKILLAKIWLSAGYAKVGYGNGVETSRIN